MNILERKPSKLRKTLVFILGSLLLFSPSGYGGNKKASKRRVIKKQYRLPKKQKKTKVVGLILPLKSYPRSRKAWKKRAAAGGYRLTLSGKRFPYAILTHKKPHLIQMKKWKAQCAKFAKVPGVKSCLFDVKTQLTRETTNTSGQKSKKEVNSDDFDFPRNCNLFDYENQMGYEGRTDFWAQEAIGADLVDQEFDELPRRSVSPVSSYVCDSDEGRHNEHVANILNGGAKNDTPADGWDCKYRRGMLQLLNRIEDQNLPQTTLVNYSMGPVDQFEADYFGEAKQFDNVVWVASSGNENLGTFNAARAMIEASEAGKLLLVGSLNPVGVPSTFSSQSTEVLISAPSDTSITSCDPNSGRCSAFGGTSGAAPQVSHGIKKALALVPDLTKEQIENMVVQTAIPMPHSFEKPRRNGAGMINSYKIWDLAKRIQRQCPRSANPKRCQDQLIASSGSHDPYANRNLYDEKDLIRQDFPECSRGGRSKKVSCSVRRQNFKKLRKKAFLAKSRSSLSQLYNQKISCLLGYHDYSDGLYLYANVQRPEPPLPSIYNIVPSEVDDRRWQGQLSLARNLQYLDPRLQTQSAEAIQKSFRQQIDKGRISPTSVIVASQLGAPGLGILTDFVTDEQTQTNDYFPIFKKAYDRVGSGALDDFIQRSSEFDIRQKRRILNVAQDLDRQKPEEKAQLLKTFLKDVPMNQSSLGRAEKRTLDGFFREYIFVAREMSPADALAVEALKPLIYSTSTIASQRAVESFKDLGAPGLTALGQIDYQKLAPFAQDVFYETLGSFGEKALPVLKNRYTGSQSPDERIEIVGETFNLGTSGQAQILKWAPKLNGDEAGLLLYKMAIGKPMAFQKPFVEALKNNRDPAVQKKLREFQKNR